jgi:hypothetical protein
MPYASTCAEAGATTFWKKKKVEKHVENNMRIVRTNYLFSHMISYQLKGLKNEIVIGDTNIVQSVDTAPWSPTSLVEMMVSETLGRALPEIEINRDTL